MKKLYEEFKLYENLWEEAEVPEKEADPFEEFNLSSSVEIALANFPYDFEIEYDGYTDTWDEDRFDPESAHGHYTVSKSRYYDNFTYEISPEDVLEDLTENFIPKYLAPDFIEKAIKRIKSEFISSSHAGKIEAEIRALYADYQKLEELCGEDCEKLNIFVADHLDTFFYIFESVFQEEYKDRARESNY